jgi:Holliday junction resolvase RusA-like endonuclease
VTAVSFTIPGQPVAKGRPKFARQGGFVRAYTPEKTVAYETLVKLAAGEAMAGAAPLQGPLSLMLRLYVQIPKSTTKRDRTRIAAGEFLPTRKPDLDNVLKAVTDAMNGIVYDDDAQIVTVMVTKLYAETPRAEVGVMRLAAEEQQAA